MIVAADAGDNPLADRREDRKAAAERERKAKVAKVASQATNAMAAVRAQLDLREKGAADKAANKANDDAGAPVGRRLRCSNECSLPASTIPNISNKCFARLREREREIWYPRVRRRRSQRQGDGDASGWAAPESKGHRGLPVLRREIG